MKRLFALAFVIGGFAMLIGLGLWQLDRRAWKHDYIQSIEAGLAAAPTSLSIKPDAGMAWRRATAAGVWRPQSLARIAPRTFDGRVGGDYAAILELPDGSALAVRLGWAPDGAPSPELAAGPQQVEGVLAPPPEPNPFTPDNAPPDDWYWLDPVALTVNAGFTPGDAAPLTLRATAPPAGLKARPARPHIVDDHLQYAMTWFALAFGWATVAFLVYRRQRRASVQP